MNKVKLCIFDMDGLLLDTERYAWDKAKKKAGKEYGVTLTDEFSLGLMGLNAKSFANELKKEFGQDFPALEYIDKSRKYYNDICINEEIPLRPGVFELLKYLKNNNIYISLGTSTVKEYAEASLKKTGIYEYLDYEVYGNEVKNGKPNPEIYIKSVEHFGFKPEECIVFEDSHIGAKAAYDGNINLIMVPDLQKPTQEDKEKALAIIDSLQEAISIISKINNN